MSQICDQVWLDGRVKKREPSKGLSVFFVDELFVVDVIVDSKAQQLDDVRWGGPCAALPIFECRKGDMVFGGELGLRQPCAGAYLFDGHLTRPRNRAGR